MTAFIDEDPRSINERLAAIGFTHHRTEDAETTGQHFICNARGERLGRFTAHQAAAMLATWEAQVTPG